MYCMLHQSMGAKLYMYWDMYLSISQNSVVHSALVPSIGNGAMGCWISGNQGGGHEACLDNSYSLVYFAHRANICIVRNCQVDTTEKRAVDHSICLD